MDGHGVLLGRCSLTWVLQLDDAHGQLDQAQLQRVELEGAPG